MVEFLYRKGDIAFAFGQSPRLSGLQGIRIHQEIQKSRPGSYMGEVGVSYRTEGTNIFLDIQGRIDGIFKQENNTIIEEIKTTQKDLDPFIAENSELHWAQAKIYAAIFAEQHRLEEVSIQLTYCQVSTGFIKNLVQKHRADDLAIFLHFSLQLYMDWLERLENWRRERNLQISQSNFPYRSFREGQIEMILDVQEALKHEDQTEKIFYLTARSTGRKIAEKTLSELHTKGLKIKSITLTAKEKICFNPEKNCTGDECDFARGYYDRLAEAREAIFGQNIWTMDEIRILAREHKLCPFELSLDLSLWADCVICDLNYVFDPRVYLRRYFLGNPTAYTFLVDEAHNLIDRSRDMYSAEICRASFLKLRRTLKDKQSSLYAINQEIVTAMKKMEEELEPDCSFLWEKDKPDQLLPQLKNFCLELERWIVSHPQAPQYQNWIELFFTTNWFLNVADLYNDNYATRLQREEHDLRLKLFCIDPSDQLKETLEKAKSAVLFSATITPISYFAQMLGCRESITKRILPSPFPPNNLCLCIASNISTLYRNREDTKDSVCRAVGTFIDSKKGNYLVFFPSYEYLHKIHPLYINKYPHHKTLVQKPGMTENEKLAFLDNFAYENNRSLAGFVVMGGIFGEGIDLSGDRLSGAAIVGVGLPGISPERELIKYHFTAQNEPGFNYAYLFPGMNRVFQAAGRVIRSEKDRGAVLLIDSRYMRLEYSSLFTGEWQTRRITNNTHMKRILDRFWNHGPQ